MWVSLALAMSMASSTADAAPPADPPGDLPPLDLEPRRAAPTESAAPTEPISDPFAEKESATPQTDEAGGDDLDEIEDLEEIEDPDEDLGLDADLEALLGETVVASASRTAETSADAPATTEVITASDMRRYGIRTLDEAFNYLSLAMTHLNTGSTGNVGARGVTIAQDFGSHVLLLLDGHVVNEASAGAAWFDVLGGMPLEMIDRIEIVYGPGSVLYGNNAMLAVVNIVSKRGGSIDGVQVTGEGAWSPNQNRFGNLGDYDSGLAGKRRRIGFLYGRGFRIKGHKADVLLSAEWLTDRQPAMEYGPQFIEGAEGIFDFGPDTGSGDPGIWGGRLPTETVGPYGYAKFRIDKFTLAVRSAWLNNNGPSASLRFGSKKGLSNANSHVDARYDFDASKKVSGVARAYMDHYLFSSDLEFPATVFCSPISPPCELQIRSESLRGGLENNWSFDWFADGRYATTLGVDGRIREARGTFFTKNAAGEAVESQPDFTVFDGAVGVYGQQIMRFTPRVAMNIGGRFDYFSYAQAFSPRAALITVPWKDASLKFIFSQAFRAPTRVELETNDEDLDPEVVRNVELSLGQRIGRHKLTLAAWGSLWTTVIQRTFTADPFNPGRVEIGQQNANQIFGLGGSMGYAAVLGNLDYAIHGTYGFNRVRLGGFGGGDIALTDDELTDLGYSRLAVDVYGRNQPLTASPAVSGNLRLGYQWGKRGPFTGAVLGLTGPHLVEQSYANPILLGLQQEESNVDVEVPTTVNGRLTISGDIAEWKPFTLGYRFAVDATSQVYGPNAVGPFLAYHVGDGSRALDLFQRPRMTLFGGFDVKLGRLGDRKKEKNR